MFIKSLLIFFFLYKVIDASDGTAGDDIMEENIKDFVADYLEEGDMVITYDAPSNKVRQRYWPNGEVAYSITTAFSAVDKQMIRKAVALITQAAPCIKFREYIFNPPRAHIEMFRGSGCSSTVGRTGSKQRLSLARGCMRSGTIVHEVLHALGFYHEQSRPDRDNYININYNNIQAGREYNFRKAIAVDSLGMEYDGQSLMHYSSTAFSNGKGPTIQWKANPRLRLGNSELSEKDKRQLNLLYCKNAPAPRTTPRTMTIRRTATIRRTNPSPVVKNVRPNNVCGDTSGNCIHIQFIGRNCSGEERRRCPYSCNACQKKESEKCLNLRNNVQNCDALAARGYCSAANSRTRYQMKISCARSCCDLNQLYAYLQNSY